MIRCANTFILANPTYSTNIEWKYPSEAGNKRVAEKVVLACVVLHNFLRIHYPTDVPDNKEMIINNKEAADAFVDMDDDPADDIIQQTPKQLRDRCNEWSAADSAI